MLNNSRSIEDLRLAIVTNQPFKSWRLEIAATQTKPAFPAERQGRTQVKSP
ncbi:MAG: hypothetical protein V7K67_02250 [Nostoc sp.]|uniref:hypothetical protein n=1 Tax=Nostoc sp. TaxID=1180 RepID=UPI002FF928BE